VTKPRNGRFASCCSPAPPGEESLSGWHRSEMRCGSWASWSRTRCRGAGSPAGRRSDTVAAGGRAGCQRDDPVKPRPHDPGPPRRHLALACADRLPTRRLVQLRRLDNGGVPSAERIVPELQQVQARDIFPMTPKAQDRFVVRVVEPDWALVLGDNAGQMSWAFVLVPARETSTRLITRSRGAIDRLALDRCSRSSGTRSTSGCNDGSCSTSSDLWRQHDAPRPRGPRGC
jgi:hypothetical protein